MKKEEHSILILCHRYPLSPPPISAASVVDSSGKAYASFALPISHLKQVSLLSTFCSTVSSLTIMQVEPLGATLNKQGIRVCG